MAERAEKGRIAIVAMLVAGGIVASCGTSEDRPGDGPGPGTPNDGGGNGNETGGGNGGGGFGGQGDSGPVDSGFSACASDSQRGKLAPLTMAMMLDSSGSMWLRTISGESKWDATKRALTTFLNDPKSSGLGIGLQYFPLFRNNAPNRCTEGAQCGANGPCVLKACSDAAGAYCDQDTDCVAPATCSVTLGQCHEEGEFKCRTDADCVNAYGNHGSCDPMIASYCFREEESCNTPDYSKPEVAMGELPGVAAALTASLDAHFPNGYTPTSAALSGLVNMATEFQTAKPGEVVVSVLVTDGLPTRCDQNMGKIASVAADAATAGVKTYVIGVFAPSEEAQAKPNLDQIAKAGGTETALIINTNQNVAQEFLQALRAIRGDALACEFTLPVPEAGVPDYGKVNVQFTPGGGGASLIPYVTAEAACGSGGWYYDVDPLSGATPSKVKLCTATCDSVKADANGAIDILQGCKDSVVR